MERNKRIDVLKAIGIILVVAGHSGSPIRNYIYTFHMPLFFFISGFLRYGQRDKTAKEFLKAKFKSIIIPYIVFWMISMLLYNNVFYLITNGSIPDFGLNQIKGLILGGKWLSSYSNNFPLWYLQLFFISIIAFELITRIKKPKLTAFLTGMLVSLTVPFQQLLPGRPIFHINVLPAAIVFLTIGYAFAYCLKEIKIIEKITNNKCIGTIFIIVGWILASKNNGDISNIKSVIYFASASLTILGIYTISEKLINNEFIIKIGSESLYILGLHILTIPYARTFSNYICNAVGLNNVFVNNFLIVTFSILICIGIIDLYRMTINYIKEEFRN